MGPEAGQGQRTGRVEDLVGEFDPEGLLHAQGDFHQAQRIQRGAERFLAFQGPCLPRQQLGDQAVHDAVPLSWQHGAPQDAGRE
ncbi:hypothetical protein P3102_34210 [Amycolatopsis sp. QT-25]|uniref:hypothetical protein n=1 Tax=Amycolatopsis sp. QT-25 TaxID=3034022 RepID=UPI0023ED9C75|nr:hypothetical protein [Amycolatopsis sp. QT-25]WET79031.1 hypothetical protein P3102_34210 [Amycolatopsis sp. QT-25]